MLFIEQMRIETDLDIYIFVRLMKSCDIFFVRLKKIVRLIYGVIRTVRLIWLDLFNKYVN